MVPNAKRWAGFCTLLAVLYLPIWSSHSFLSFSLYFNTNGMNFKIELLSMSNSFIFCRICSAWMLYHHLELTMSKTKLISDDLHPTPAPFSFIWLPYLPRARWPCWSSHPRLKSRIVLFWVFFLLLFNWWPGPTESTFCLTSLLISVTGLTTHLDHSPYFLPCLITHYSFFVHLLNWASASTVTLS